MVFRQESRKKVTLTSFELALASLKILLFSKGVL